MGLLCVIHLELPALCELWGARKPPEGLLERVTSLLTVSH